METEGARFPLLPQLPAVEEVGRGLVLGGEDQGHVEARAGV